MTLHLWLVNLANYSAQVAGVIDSSEKACPCALRE